MPELNGTLTRRCRVAVYCLVLAGSGLEAGWCDRLGLREQLRLLTEIHAIRIVGLDRVTGDAVPIRRHAPLMDQLVELLSNHDYALVHGPYGGVTSLYIVGPRAELSPDPDEEFIEMQRIGPHTLVDAELHISPRQSFQLRMIVDPAADCVLLPDSVRIMLRLPDSDLFDTAVIVGDEIVAARLTTVDAISVGSLFARDVDVAFVSEGDFSENRILGRSFLEKLHLEVDDVRDRLFRAEP